MATLGYAISAPAPALEVRGLRFDYGDGRTLGFPDLDLAYGTHGLVLGPSGCGKSTLLHLVTGLLRARAGTIHVAGTDMTSLRGAALDRFRGAHIGIVFQRLHLLPALSVRDNLLAAQYLAGLPQDRARVDTLLERLDIAHRGGARPDALSFGQAQRVAIARALVNAPELIVADEPTSNLDDRNTAEVMSLLLEHATLERATLLVATHDARLRPHFEQLVELAA